MKLALIVDDSSVVRKFIKNLFLELGFEVTDAEDGQAALEKFKLKIPDVIMLDWNMPGMNGMQFLVELRKQENGKEPVVIFCTTENEPHKIAQAMADGANGFITKPFDVGDIRTKLQQLRVL
jgi:two-component system chemotaxis response regulator CheY